MAKICLIADSLGKGGAEHMICKLSNAFTKQGHQVIIIILKNHVDYSFSGQLINLGNYDSGYKLIKQFIKLLAFKKTYTNTDADVFIDFRVRSRKFIEFILHQFVFDLSKTVFSIRSFNIYLHIPKASFFYKSYSKTKAIVCPTQEIIDEMKEVYPFKNLIYIPNFFLEGCSLFNKDAYTTPSYVAVVGRLNNEIKQFDKLILAYKKSKLSSLNVKLNIYGDGEDKDRLMSLIKSHELDNFVILKGFTKELFSELSNAFFTVLCSKYEGFPNVLLESLSFGTPVVSFDCKSGPSDLVKNGENGILVEDQNFNALTKAMNKMVCNKSFYNTCKSNAKKSVERFSSSHVIKSWEAIVNRS